ncbi:MAG: cytochrome P450 [Acidimicrobiales bacterium]
MTEPFDPDATLIRVLTDPACIPDPYPLYNQLRDHAPIFQTSVTGTWVVNRYEHAKAMLRDPRCGSGAGLEGGDRTAIDGSSRRARTGALSMLFLNPPDHTRVRGLVARSFTPRRVEQMRPEVEAMCDALLDDLDGDGDFVDKVAFPLPANVISALVGVPEADREFLRPLIYDLGVGIEPTATDDEIAAADTAGEEITAYVVDLIARRRADPQDDLLSGMIEAKDGEDKLTEDEIIVNTLLIYAAGFETTTHLLGNTVRQLVAHPDQHQLLRSDRSLVPGAIEEVLRFDPPVQMDGRYVFEDLELGGVTIPAGSGTMTLIGAVNRDPDVVDDPDRFDVTRTDTQVLSFGSGIHYCLGAALARLEGQALLDRMLDRYDTWEIVGEPSWRRRFTLRGVEHMHVRLS